MYSLHQMPQLQQIIQQQQQQQQQLQQQQLQLHQIQHQTQQQRQQIQQLQQLQQQKMQQAPQQTQQQQILQIEQQLKQHWELHQLQPQQLELQQQHQIKQLKQELQQQELQQLQQTQQQQIQQIEQQLKQHWELHRILQIAQEMKQDWKLHELQQQLEQQQQQIKQLKQELQQQELQQLQQLEPVQQELADRYDQAMHSSAAQQKNWRDNDHYPKIRADRQGGSNVDRDRDGRKDRCCGDRRDEARDRDGNNGRARSRSGLRERREDGRRHSTRSRSEQAILPSPELITMQDPRTQNLVNLPRNVGNDFFNPASSWPDPSPQSMIGSVNSAAVGPHSGGPFPASSGLSTSGHPDTSQQQECVRPMGSVVVKPMNAGGALGGLIRGTAPPIMVSSSPLQQQQANSFSFTVTSPANLRSSIQCNTNLSPNLASSVHSSPANIPPCSLIASSCTSSFPGGVSTMAPSVKNSLTPQFTPPPYTSTAMNVPNILISAPLKVAACSGGDISNTSLSHVSQAPNIAASSSPAVTDSSNLRLQSSSPCTSPITSSSSVLAATSGSASLPDYKSEVTNFIKQEPMDMDVMKEPSSPEGLDVKVKLELETEVEDELTLPESDFYSLPNFLLESWKKY